MEFYASLIKEAYGLLEELEQSSYAYSSEKALEDIGYNQVILQRDTAFELEGTGFNLFTCSEISDGITVVGDDLQKIDNNRKFARISLVQLEDCDGEQELYKLIKKADYVKYHFFPKGYMIRTTSRTHKESVRVAKSALKAGATFERVGNLMIKKYKENPRIKGVRIIFITDTAADIRRLEALAGRSFDITETLNHIMNNVKFDCDSCNLKAVCDEVEEMRELHFSNAGGMGNG